MILDFFSFLLAGDLKEKEPAGIHNEQCRKYKKIDLIGTFSLSLSLLLLLSEKKKKEKKGQLLHSLSLPLPRCNDHNRSSSLCS
jgi:hypothetical protein